MKKLTDNAKKLIEDAGNWTMTGIIDEYYQFIMDEHGIGKNDARKVLARTLASATVENEMKYMINYIVTGETDTDKKEEW